MRGDRFHAFNTLCSFKSCLNPGTKIFCFMFNGSMAEQPEQLLHEEDEVSDVQGYKPPAQKSMTEILQQDQEDESLRKYKEDLLGANPHKVVVCK